MIFNKQNFENEVYVLDNQNDRIIQTEVKSVETKI